MNDFHQITVEELLYIGCRMAEELQAFVDEAEEAASPLPSVKALVEDWEKVFKKSDRYWKNNLVGLAGDKTDEKTLLAEL